MRILTLAVASALMLSTACKPMDDEAVKASALPEVSVPELSEQTMKDVVKELSLAQNILEEDVEKELAAIFGT